MLYVPKINKLVDSPLFSCIGNQLLNVLVELQKNWMSVQNRGLDVLGARFFLHVCSK